MQWKKRFLDAAKDKETLLFLIWLTAMAVYYGYRLFALTPWYDELYTYYYFISRGPVYAALHWPLPNNHVGYSVLSGMMNWLGNAAVGLRGVSYLSSLLSLVLLYKIGRTLFKSGWSIVCVVCYGTMQLVNQLAVQGRGYALASACFLTAIYMLLTINGKKGERRHYIIFAMSLTLSLYTVPSSVYWVLPLCLTGGLALLLNHKKKELVQLVVSSAAAAAATVFLYALIWLAIGSNLLTKLEGGPFFGKGHVSIILSAPFQALGAGIDYMLASPYIQSVGRIEFFNRFPGWLESLLQMFLPNGGFMLAAVLAAGVVCIAGAEGLRHIKAKRELSLIPLLIVLFIFVTPVLLLVQSTLPYVRVFSYLGVIFSLIITLFAQMIFDRGGGSHVARIVLPAGICLLSLFVLLTPSYLQQYGTNEHDAFDALQRADAAESENLCVTDCYQQYILKYYWDRECENTQIEDSDFLLFSKEMADPDFDGFRWEFYHSYDTIPWEYVGQNFTLSYENDTYLLYMKNP